MQQQHIRCIPTPDLPLTLTDLVQLLEQRLPTLSSTHSTRDSGTYQQACAALARRIRHDCQTLRAQVTSEFRAFDHIMAQEQGVTPLAPSQAPQPDTASEQAFLSHLLCLLLLGRYRPLTDAEEDAALRDSFTLTAPITIQYDKLDPTLLTTFWAGSAQRQEARALLPPSADRVLVFHRGVGRATAEGVYLPDKLNLLLRHMARPLWASARRWLDPGYVARLEARLAGVANTEVDGDDKQLVVSCPPLTVERRSLVVLAPSAGAVLGRLGAVMGLQEPTFKQVVVLYRNAVADAEDEDPNVVSHHVQEYLPYEVSDAMNEIQNSLSSEDANQQQQLQPQLTPVQFAKQLPGRVAHQVRQSVDQTQQKVRKQVQSSVLRSLELLKGAPHVEGQQVPEGRRLQLGLFTSVPLADLELVLPHKQVYPQPVRIVQLVFTAATALLGTLAATWQTLANRPAVPPGTPGLVHKAADPATAAVLSTAVSGAVKAVQDELAQVPALLLALSGVLLLRAGQMYFSIKRSTQPLLNNMKLQASKKQLGRQAAVISAVVDQIQAALLQEATLCWSLLLAAEQPRSLEEFSHAAGELLSDACGQPVVLDLGPAARRLVQLGLVEVSSPATSAAAAETGGEGDRGNHVAEVLTSPAAAADSTSTSSSTFSSVSSSGHLMDQVLLTAVPVDRALALLEAQWQQRHEQELTDAAAGQDTPSLGQQLGEVAAPEVWEWVQQEAQLALADMGVALSSIDGGPRGGRRFGSPPGGVGAANGSMWEQPGPGLSAAVVPAQPRKGVLPHAGSSTSPGRRVVARAAPIQGRPLRRQHPRRLPCCGRGAAAAAVAAAAWR